MSYLINPYIMDSSSGSNCTSPNVSYTFPSQPPYNQPTALSHEVTTGCYLKPILRVASIVYHNYTGDNWRFWVNCTVGGGGSWGPNNTSNGGGGCDDTGNNLAQGRSFTKAQLIAGIDLNDYDSTNAPALDSSDSSAGDWNVTITPFDISDCPTDIGGLCLGSGTGYTATSQAWWMDTPPPVYDDDPLGQYPQFDNGDGGSVDADTGSSSDWVLRLNVAPNYYADSSSMGDDSFGATTFKIFIQYETSCNQSGGCSSMSWTNAIDNDTFFDAGDAGAGNEQTFNIVEADCWSEDYIFVRYMIRAYGPCMGITYTDEDWTAAEEVDLGGLGVQCNGL